MDVFTREQLKIFNKFNFKNIYVISGYKNRAINEKKLGVKKFLIRIIEKQIWYIHYFAQKNIFR